MNESVPSSLLPGTHLLFAINAPKSGSPLPRYGDGDDDCREMP